MITQRRLLPPLGALCALEALDRLGSASAVAEELSLTQGAVSRQLQTLETQLGIALISRERKRLSLTPAGRDYVTEIRAGLNQIARASLRLTIRPAGGTLTLAILPTFGMRWLMPRLPEFARRHPDVTINMTTRLEPFSFASEPVDAAIHFGRPDWPGTGALLLRAERVLPVAAPSLLPDGPPDDPARLLRLPLLHIQTRPRAWQDWFARLGVAADTPLPGMIHDQFATITQAALHGLGVALMPDYMVEEDLATGRLRAAHPEPVEAQGAYYLVWPQGKSADPALLAFRDWLAGQAEPEDPMPR